MRSMGSTLSPWTEFKAVLTGQEAPAKMSRKNRAVENCNIFEKPSDFDTGLSTGTEMGMSGAEMSEDVSGCGKTRSVETSPGQ